MGPSELDKLLLSFSGASGHEITPHWEYNFIHPTFGVTMHISREIALFLGQNPDYHSGSWQGLHSLKRSQGAGCLLFICQSRKWSLVACKLPALPLNSQCNVIMNTYHFTCLCPCAEHTLKFRNSVLAMQPVFFTLSWPSHHVYFDGRVKVSGITLK